jgi:hypothetical protein
MVESPHGDSSALAAPNPALLLGTRGTVTVVTNVASSTRLGVLVVRAARDGAITMHDQ